MNPKALAVGLALSTACALAAQPAHAFQLVPMTREFAPAGEGATQSYQLVNESDEPVALEVSMVTRAMGLDGREVNADAGDDFLVYPPQIIVAARGRQTLRVSYMGDPEPPAERAFRLVVQQLPIASLSSGREPARSASGGVRVLLEYRASVYVQPRAARPDVRVERIEGVRGPRGDPLLAVQMHNAGTGRANLRDCVLEVRARGRASPPVEISPGDLEPGPLVLLAGGRRRLTFPWPRELPWGEIDGLVLASSR